MAKSAYLDINEKICLDEFTEYVSKNVNPRDEESIFESSFMLKKLSKNKNFFTDKLNHELENWEKFQNINLYSAQTFTFWASDDFLVRANIWVPPTEVETRTWTNDMFYYLVPHDHNFSILTVGFWGTGYRTTIYEYDYEKIVGFVGEKVGLRFLENTQLEEGKVMFYRPSKDIHSQEHPEEFSISLNLLATGEDEDFRDQYCFDFETQTIQSNVGSTNMTRTMLLKIAKHIGDGKTANLIESIANVHPAPSVRYEAFSSLVKIYPNYTEKIWEKATLDKSEYVHLLAKANLVV
jgi:hypothetical protein